jgi:hypothetical protein
MPDEPPPEPRPSERSDLAELVELTRGASRAWAEVTGPDGYLPVLVLLLGWALASMLIGDLRWGAVAAGLLGSSALLVTVFRSTDHIQIRVVAAIAVAVTALVAVAQPLLTGDHHAPGRWIGRSAYLALVTAALPLVLVRAMRHRRVTLNTLCATVSAYLLLGILFSGIYVLHHELAPPFFAQEPDPAPGAFTYFSFVTLTTTGFGDLTPGSDPARAWAVLEAVVGQVFVITALARVVSLLGVRRPDPDPGSLRSDPPP